MLAIGLASTLIFAWAYEPTSQCLGKDADVDRTRTVAGHRFNDYVSGGRTSDHDLVSLAAAVGDRERANAAAARIDAHRGSAFVLSEVVFLCFCGAPFELDATPDFRARITEAGLPWPPPSPIRYPNKQGSQGRESPATCSYTLWPASFLKREPWNQ